MMNDRRVLVIEVDEVYLYTDKGGATERDLSKFSYSTGRCR